MSGKQTVITILGVAAIAGCSWSFNAWLDQQSFNKKSEVAAKLSEQETARYQMIKDLASEVVSLERSKEGSLCLNQMAKCIVDLNARQNDDE